MAASVTKSDKARVKGRVRKRSLDTWVGRDKKCKILKDSGQSYVSKRGKGKLVDEKKPPSTARGCSASCSKPGCKSLTVPSVHALHKQFYGLNYNEQTLKLLKSITMRDPRRRRSGKSEENSQRLATFDYAINGKAVCKKTLCNVFSVTVKRIQVLQEKIKCGELAPKDRRGLHLNRPHATDSDVRQKIRGHINSFPREINHCTRNTSCKQCLNPDLTVQKMYSLFKEKFPEDEISCTLYENIFQTEFNLQFGTPRSDTCKQCNEIYARLILTSNEDERKSIELESVIHHAKVDQAYGILAADLKNDSFITISVDLQQALLTPMLTHSDMHYQRQYSSYNLSIHNMSSDDAAMFLWHESVAKREAKDVGSCILKYVTSTFETLTIGQERKLIVWSDRCVGQNNNWTILNLYHYFIRSGFFTEIHQKFMTTGHSFLPCDHNFALIEHAKSKQNALVPSDWMSIISSAKPSKPFTVFEMTQDDFMDLDFISKGIKKKVQIAKYVWYKLSADDPTSLYARETHNTLRPWTSQQVFPKLAVRCCFDELPLLYQKPLPISKEKKADLMDMTKYLTNSEHKSFYENLPAV